jgi:DNA-binding transcriptional MerR regulator
MNDKKYNMTELEKISGVPRRTIHFYSQEGIIPPPFGTGGAAKYGEAHLLRLKLIKALKKSHLKLSGIKEALDAMDLDEMRNLLLKSGESPSWENISLENWISSEDTGFSYSAMDRMKDDLNSEKDLFSIKQVSSQMRTSEPESVDRNYLRSLKRKTDTKTQWERYEVGDGVEISMRSDVDRRTKNMIMRLIEELKKEFM